MTLKMNDRDPYYANVGTESGTGNTSKRPGFFRRMWDRISLFFVNIFNSVYNALLFTSGAAKNGAAAVTVPWRFMWENLYIYGIPIPGL